MAVIREIFEELDVTAFKFIKTKNRIVNEMKNHKHNLLLQSEIREEQGLFLFQLIECAVAYPNTYNEKVLKKLIVQYPSLNPSWATGVEISGRI